MADTTHIEVELLKVDREDPYIGRGGFGQVWKVYSKRHGVVAVKTEWRRSEGDIQKFKSEAEKLNCVTPCKYIISPIGWFVTTDLTALVMDYAEYGSLDHLLHDSNIELQNDLKFRFLYELAFGINYLHHNTGSDQRLLHRDLKPLNLLLDGDFHIKICDFGGAVFSTFTQYWESNTGRTGDSVASLAYCAPERLRNERSSSKVDIFSFGVIAWEVITRERPFAREGNERVVRSNILNGVRPSMQYFLENQQFQVLGDLIQSCWHNDCEARPNAEHVLELIRRSCPVNKIQVARQVADLVEIVPDHPLIPERATYPLLEAIRSFHPPIMHTTSHFDYLRRNAPLTPSVRRPSNSLHQQRGEGYNGQRHLNSNQTPLDGGYGFFPSALSSNNRNLPNHSLASHNRSNNSSLNFPIYTNAQRNVQTTSFTNQFGNYQQDDSSEQVPAAPSSYSRISQNDFTSNNPRITPNYDQSSTSQPNTTLQSRVPSGSGTSRPNFVQTIRDVRNMAGQVVANNMPFVSKQLVSKISGNVSQARAPRLEGRPAGSNAFGTHHALRCVVLGDEKVGKQNLVNVYKKASNRTIRIKEQAFKFEIDIGVPALRGHCHVVILCFSTKLPESFDNIQRKWLEVARSYQATRNAAILLVMTNTQLLLRPGYRKRLVDENQAKTLAEDLNVTLCEYAMNDKDDAIEVFTKAFTLATEKL